MRQVFVLAGILALTLPLVAQEGRGGGRGRANQPPLGPIEALGQEVRRPPSFTGPAPRLPDGTVDLNGLWIGGGPGGTSIA